jgi:uncharacterized protein (TIGR03492 family)
LYIYVKLQKLNLTKLHNCTCLISLALARKLMQLLCISNGHGEDVIAVRILEQLQRQPQAPQIFALPLVGEGHAYSQIQVPLVGPVQSMPSGGFIYMDGRQLWRDVQGGLIQLTLAQYKIIRHWGQQGGKILAVGDIVPLLLAWLSGADYAFVGTAKSEYYLRDELGWLPQTSPLERWMGSVYLPWERWLMSRQRCKAVFPRDSLTGEILQQWSIPAFDLGNPMMDGMEAPVGATPLNCPQDILTVLLLPGSRMPEAQQNWQILMAAIASVMSVWKTRSLLFLAAIAPSISLESFTGNLLDGGWLPQPLESLATPIPDCQALAFGKEEARLILTQNAYSHCLQAANLAIGMAGTATEQFVGLGKPVLTIPGAGPQFTYAFAEAQTRLLGCSILLVNQPQQVGKVMASLVKNPDLWLQIAENGPRRMGKSGAALRIAHTLMAQLLCFPNRGDS